MWLCPHLLDLLELWKSFLWVCWLLPEVWQRLRWISLQCYCPSFLRGHLRLRVMTITVIACSLPEWATISFRRVLFILAAVIRSPMVTFSFCVRRRWSRGLVRITGAVVSAVCCLLWRLTSAERGEWHCFGGDSMLQACNRVSFLLWMFMSCYFLTFDASVTEQRGSAHLIYHL